MGQMTLSEFSEESSSRISVVRKDALEMLELERVFSQQGRIGRWRNYITKDTKGRPTILKQSTQPPPYSSWLMLTYNTPSSCWKTILHRSFTFLCDLWAEALTVLLVQIIFSRMSVEEQTWKIEIVPHSTAEGRFTYSPLIKRLKFLKLRDPLHNAAHKCQVSSGTSSHHHMGTEVQGMSIRKHWYSQTQTIITEYDE